MKGMSKRTLQLNSQGESKNLNRGTMVRFGVRNMFAIQPGRWHLGLPLEINVIEPQT